MDTKLFVRKQSGGMFSIFDAAITTGKYFFVHSGTGSDTSGYGQNPDAPFATINYAFSSAAVTANKGDIVYAMPGHAESGTSAGFLDLDVAGVSVIGIGHGTDVPTVTHGHADAEVDIDAANILIENIHFIAGIDDVKICLDVNADDFTLRNCRFTGDAADHEYLVCVQDGTATTSDRMTIEGCHTLMGDAAGTEFVALEGTGDGHIIRDNVLVGDWGTACIGGAGAYTRCVIINNYIYNAATDADACIVANNASGLIANNRCVAGHASQGIITGSECGCVENYYNENSAADSGNLEPAAT